MAVVLPAVWAANLLRRWFRLEPKLVLHFDVNETLMVGDPAGGDSFGESLNKVICKSAFLLDNSVRRCVVCVYVCVRVCECACVRVLYDTR